GNVTDNGGLTLTKVGVVYAPTSTNPNPTIGGSGVTDGDLAMPATGVFTIDANGRKAATRDSLAAFATNSGGTSYSNIATFTTLPPTPIVTSPTSADLTLASATLGGNVTGVGASPLSKVGVVYALTGVNSSPTIGGPGVTEVDVATPATGVFTVSA